MVIIIYTLLATHITILCVTLFLHRSQAHRGVTFNPAVSHFMRFWLWLTTGMITKEWVAIHRKHHSSTDIVGDPHSPVIEGVFNILFRGAFFYHRAARDVLMIEQYGKGTPEDWLERNLYSKYNNLGICLLLALNILLFGVWGIVSWLVQIAWIPFWAAGVVNGLGHCLGYRNTDTNDHSTNLVPLGLIIGGEELHNNHHADPGNPKLSQRWWEIDVGWVWIYFLRLIRLCEVRFISR